MCTHIVLKNSNSNLISARTMDFSLELNPLFVSFPRNYEMNLIFEGNLNKHYAFCGLGKNVGDYYLADGINEHGLSCAALYFEGFSSYSKEKYKDKVNLAPHEFLHYILSNFKSSQEILENIENINILDHTLDFIGKAAPLHWVITDSSSRSIIIEPLDEGLKVYENKVGVLTNSPDLDWHYTNLRNYIGLDIHQREDRKIGDLLLQPFGQGSGSFGLPGDFTPPSRFVRTLFNKLSCNVGESQEDLLADSCAILNNVMITKGSVKTINNSIDYTQYVSYIMHDTLTYYFKTYTNPNIRSFSLLDSNIDDDKILVLEIDDKFSAKDILKNNI